MKAKNLLIIGIAAFVTAAAGAADVYQQGYVRQDGTYVQPHYQTAPNNTVYDNYSTRGNVNPYTGQAGTHNPQQSYGTPSYQYQQPTYQQPTIYQPQRTYQPRW